LTTLEDVLRETLVTFLAIIGAADVSPVLMDTVVLLPKHFGCCLDALDPVFGTLGLRNTVNDDVCSRKQVPLLPLFTGASLPPKTAHIAELSSASTSVKSQPVQQHCRFPLRYVIATDFQLHNTPTVVAPLPVLLVCEVDNGVEGSVVWAFTDVTQRLANRTCYDAAAAACRCVAFEFISYYEGRASGIAAVRSVWCAEFDPLLFHTLLDVFGQKDTN
jgi:hypothetical protein